MKYVLSVAISAMLAVTAVSYAQDMHSGHEMHGASTGDSPSTKAFKEANAKMHAGMDIPFSGDADVDFVKGMIPHHQGAIDMAEVVLQYGKDAKTRRLAASIIKAQKKEIAEMQAWLKTKGK